jgi:hypothetical protein
MRNRRSGPSDGAGRLLRRPGVGVTVVVVIAGASWPRSSWATNAERLYFIARPAWSTDHGRSSSMDTFGPSRQRQGIAGCRRVRAVRRSSGGGYRELDEASRRAASPRRSSPRRRYSAVRRGAARRRVHLRRDGSTTWRAGRTAVAVRRVLFSSLAMRRGPRRRARSWWSDRSATTGIMDYTGSPLTVVTSAQASLRSRRRQAAGAFAGDRGFL